MFLQLRLIWGERRSVKYDSGAHQDDVGVRARLHLFVTHVQEFARGHMSVEMLQAARIGKMTTLQKSQGGICGIVIGDFIRQVIACPLVQQQDSAVEYHTSSFQFALSCTDVGASASSPIAQAMTDLGPSTTLLPVDGIEAFNLISREVMLQALMEVDGGDAALSFVRKDVTHEMRQGEGGEQGDPLMPALYVWSDWSHS